MEESLLSAPRSLVVATIMLAAAPFAGATMLINPIFDSSVTARGDSADIQAAFNYAASQFTSRYTDNITLNITVSASSGVALGQSTTQLYGSAFNYATIKVKLGNDASSADDATANASLLATDPTGGGLFVLTRAQAKALGVLSATSVASDGTFTFSSNQTYTFDPNNRAVSGKFDFIGVAMHEISEIMGRNEGLNTSGFPYYMIYDLFRYSSVGNRAMTAGASAYFSVNGGATNLKAFNTNSAGDYQDWASGSNDAFNAFTSSGVEGLLSPVDIRTLDVIGYNLATPEPSEVLPFLLSFGFIGWKLRRQRNKG